MMEVVNIRWQTVGAALVPEWVELTLANGTTIRYRAG